MNQRTLLPVLFATLCVVSLLSWRTVVRGAVDAPVAVDDGAFVVAAGGRLVHAAPGVLANDTGSAPLTARLTRGPLFGSLDLAPDGSFTYTHGGLGTAPDSFRYRASDGSRESLEAHVPIAVIPAHGATLHVPDDHPSIQDAHDAATSGDLILIAPGTYEENLELSKAVTLASWFLTTGDDRYVDTTLLDGRGRAFVVDVLEGAEPPTLVGLTIQNADDGITGRAPFHLLRSRVRFTTDGIDYEHGSGGTVRYCLFEENSDDGIDPDHDVDVRIEHNVIRNNGGDGIEIRLQPYQGPTLHYVIRHNEIYGNQEDGIQLIDYDVLTDRRFEIAYNAIYDNVQAGMGMMSGANTRENFEGASIQEPILILGNTFARNDHGLTGGDNTVVLNNLFVGHTRIAVKNVDGASELAYNLFHDNGTDAENAHLDPATTFAADPLLGPDLRLLAASPAIDLGTDHYVFQGQTVLDLDPARYQGSAPDLGAFEWLPGTGLGPRAPDLLEPLDGAPLVSLTPILRWQGSADAFQLQVATDPGFASAHLVHDVSIPGDQRSHLLAPGLLDHATDYLWRVRGSDTTGTGAWSSVFRFTTLSPQGPPEAPHLIEPLHGTGDLPLTPRLAWRGAADLFHLQIAREADFEHLLLDLVLSEESTVVAEGLLEHAASYHWRVAGENGFGLGPWSLPASFSTRPPPLPLSAPYDLRAPVRADTSIDLRWSAFDDPRVVAFRIYRDGSPIASESENDHHAVDLLPDTLYRFHVTALDSRGDESPPSATLDVATLPEPPEIVALSVSVGADEDDAEEPITSSAPADTRDLRLELGEDAGKGQVVGIRFRQLDVPAGAWVEGARIRFTATSSEDHATSLIVEGEASDDAAAFQERKGSVEARPTTDAFVVWDPPAWSFGASGSDQQTPELSGVVQEIVDRPGWASGNAIAFFVSGSGRRAAHSHDASAADAARLEVEYLDACALDADADGYQCELDCDDTDAAVHPGASELCDGADNDCDGSVDEGDAVDAHLWYADRDGDGHGDLATTLLACSQPTSWVANPGDCDDADGTAFPGAAERCNGRDDDCDGLTDEDYVAQPTQCGVGACGAVGSTACVAGVVVDNCQPGIPAPSDASCDGVDDDCDGLVDDEYLAPPTSCGVGACGASGALECLVGQLVDTCQPGAPAPLDGLCNAVDDDCDGAIDEDFEPQSCSTGQLGVCAGGTTTCEAGAMRCVQLVQPGPGDALCNGLDDDCDGAVDENYQSQSCATGAPGVCADGTTLCEGGAERCEADRTAEPEVCRDGLDNDCDGDVDYPADASCILTSLRVPISATEDDAEERVHSGGAVSLKSSDLEMTQDGDALQLVGLRFRDVALPRDADVLSAHLQFVADEPDEVPTALSIEGQAADDAPPFRKLDGDVSARARTGHGVSWSPPPWAGAGAMGPEQRTPELATIVQEIVDRPGWAAGNAMAFVISGSGHRTARAYQDTPQGATALEIAYLSACAADQDGDGAECAVDCDDRDPSVHPGAFDGCNGIDDDCDGTVDEDFAPQACSTGQPGICSEGTSSCEAGAERCEAAHTAEPEICGDGLDNDCDGGLDGADADDCASFSLAIPVAASEDDAEERLAADGSVSLASRSLELAEELSGPLLVGVRFRGVDVPQGATVVAASVQFTADAIGDAPTSLVLEAEASDDAAAFARVDGDLSVRNRTAASVAWEPPPWTATGDAGSAQRTPDLSAVVQELVDRPGWSPGNAVVLLLSGTGARGAEAFDGAPGGAAVLQVEYVLPLP